MERLIGKIVLKSKVDNIKCVWLENENLAHKWNELAKIMNRSGKW